MKTSNCRAWTCVTRTIGGGTTVAVFLLVTGKAQRRVGAELRGTGPQVWRGVSRQRRVGDAGRRLPASYTSRGRERDIHGGWGRA